MRVFVTGATGFIGTEVVAELVAHGHQVLALARSEEKAAALRLRGPRVQVLMGDKGDAAVIREGIAATDAVAHLAFDHDFSRFAENCEADRALIGVMGAALAGSDKRLVVTSGLALPNSQPGLPATEDGAVTGTADYPRAASEEAARALGGHVMVMRLPQVHDRRRFGLVSYLFDLWRREGACLWLGDGQQRWPAAHLTDVARAYRLALEKGRAGEAFHAVAEEGVTMRAIAEAAAPRLGLPARGLDPDQAARFGWLAHFVTSDLPASSALTRDRLGWQPEGPGMLEDLGQMEA